MADRLIYLIIERNQRLIIEPIGIDHGTNRLLLKIERELAERLVYSLS